MSSTSPLLPPSAGGRAHPHLQLLFGDERAESWQEAGGAHLLRRLWQQWWVSVKPWTGLFGHVSSNHLICICSSQTNICKLNLWTKLLCRSVHFLHLHAESLCHFLCSLADTSDAFSLSTAADSSTALPCFCLIAGFLAFGDYTSANTSSSARHTLTNHVALQSVLLSPSAITFSFFFFFLAVILMSLTTICRCLHNCFNVSVG